jgi:hypothetical protein
MTVILAGQEVASVVTPVGSPDPKCRPVPGGWPFFPIRRVPAPRQPSEASRIHLPYGRGRPGHWRLTSEFVGEVGRAALSGAGAVWVVVHYPELSRDGIADLARRRRELLDSGEEPPRTWSAAVADGDGSVQRPGRVGGGS